MVHLYILGKKTKQIHCKTEKHNRKSQGTSRMRNLFSVDVTFLKYRIQSHKKLNQLQSTVGICIWHNTAVLPLQPCWDVFSSATIVRRVTNTTIAVILSGEAVSPAVTSYEWKHRQRERAGWLSFMSRDSVKPPSLTGDEWADSERALWLPVGIGMAATQQHWQLND